MDGATIAAKVAAGYAKAANVIGTSHQWYRGGLINPVAVANKLGALNAAWSVDAQFKLPPNYKTMLYRAFIDTSQVLPGDILVGQYTFVMLETGPIEPPLALITTDQITVQRATTPAGAGEQGYGAPTTVQTIAQGLPANVQVKKEVGTPPVKLPSDLGRDTYWDISFYAADGAVKDGDIIIDGEGYRYQVTAANWQSIFYHCLCQRLES